MGLEGGVWAPLTVPYTISSRRRMVLLPWFGFQAAVFGNALSVPERECVYMCCL